MARVIVTSGLRGEIAMAAGEYEVEARTLFELIDRLDECWPGTAEVVGAGIAVAVDGELVSDWSLSLGRSSEVMLVPHIAGG